MTRDELTQLAEDSIAGALPSPELCERLLTDPSIELLPLLDAAFRVRQHYKGREVSIHILSNAQSGHCPEDCGYCSQANTSDSTINEYPQKKDEEILEEARLAHAAGAFRYCMVYAGTGPSKTRTEKLASLIREIKSRYSLEVCVSAGLLNDEHARTLKEAGLDRLNHNLNTSEAFYPEICSTHTYQDRVDTLTAARNVGLDVCSGMIVGMGETAADVVETAHTLRRLKAPSIPINFLVSIPGNRISEPVGLSPDYCLRVLCMFRFVNPTAELRTAAGREAHLRSMEVMALYPANSLFLDGYLTTRGNSRAKTLKMIQDAGFTIQSDQDLDDLVERESSISDPNDADRSIMKSLEEMRPAESAKNH